MSFVKKWKLVTAKGFATALFLALMLPMPLMPAAFSAARIARAQSTMAERSDFRSASELTALLREFLDSAGRGDRAMFEKFFADDVIYTRSSGIVTNKAEILLSLEKLRPTEENTTSTSSS